MDAETCEVGEVHLAMTDFPLNTVHQSVGLPYKTLGRVLALTSRPHHLP